MTAPVLVGSDVVDTGGPAAGLVAFFRAGGIPPAVLFRAVALPLVVPDVGEGMPALLGPALVVIEVGMAATVATPAGPAPAVVVVLVWDAFCLYMRKKNKHILAHIFQREITNDISHTC